MKKFEGVTHFDKAIIGPITTISGAMATWFLSQTYIPDAFDTPEMEVAVATLAGLALGAIATYIFPNKEKK